jgi:hypothetical protein
MISRFEIIAPMAFKFTASALSFSERDNVRLWLSHFIRPLAITAVENVDDRSIGVAVRVEGSWHSKLVRAGIAQQIVVQPRHASTYDSEQVTLSMGKTSVN